VSLLYKTQGENIFTHEQVIEGWENYMLRSFVICAILPSIKAIISRIYKMGGTYISNGWNERYRNVQR